ncbi:MAG: AAA family ATPase [Culturomica sp.]|nr:AAA family ATPase [Culturomica sp.]
MISKHFEDTVLKHFGFEFSGSQKKAIDEFISFYFNHREDNLFVLKGYAGTGKTSLISSIIKTLKDLKQNFVLLAPTGRAAKVFSAYSGESAYTIHKKIYRQKSATDVVTTFSLAFNKHFNTLFFVDEASMISNSSGDSAFGSGRLLDDLMEYVYAGSNNRLVLIGDTAQLPPVGLELSPALDGGYLSKNYSATVYEADMIDVMRQSELSGILSNAIVVRALIGCNDNLKLKVNNFPDVFNISGGELLEALEDCYGKYGVDSTMVVCYSNKRANRYNGGIRRTVLYREDEFCNGDKIMIVKNNYFWCENDENLDFIANGDIATVVKVHRTKELHGFRFANADVSLNGRDDEINVWLMLDTLTSDYPALSSEDNRKFFLSVEQDYKNIRSRRKRMEAMRKDEFFNALQIKFAYAVTGHKAQGGQWDAVFIDQGWLTEDMLNDNYWRWLYTAITRARKRLYFVNFKKEFF